MIWNDVYGFDMMSCIGYRDCILFDLILLLVERRVRLRDWLHQVLARMGFVECGLLLECVLLRDELYQAGGASRNAC